MVESLSCDTAERVDDIPCGCTYSFLFPHQQGNCDLVRERAQTAAYVALAGAGAAIVAGIAVAATGASKKEKKKSK